MKKDYFINDGILSIKADKIRVSGNYINFYMNDRLVALTDKDLFSIKKDFETIHTIFINIIGRTEKNGY